jgi:spermidine synthase
MNRTRFPLLALALLVSGASGLALQVAWSDRLSLVLGAGEVAIAAVVAATMSGLALGAWLGGRFAGGKRPGIGYAAAELTVSAGALLVPALGWLVGAAESVLVASGWPAMGPGWMLFEALAAIALLLLPATAMGAALPLLAAALGDDSDRRGLGALYAVNTLGAAVGAACASFWLLPALGLAATERLAAAGHATAGLLVLLLVSARARQEVREPRGRSAPALLLAALALASVASFVLEMLWSRLLAYLLGSSLAGFGAMLSLFLLGLALGAGVASHPRLAGRPLASFVALQAFAGLSSALAFLALSQFAARLPPEGAALGTRLLIASALLLPLTFLLGAGVPLAFRAAAERGAGGPLAAGQILAASTVGAVAGVTLGGFVLLPKIGFEGTARAGAIVALSAALSAALALPWRRSAESGRSPTVVAGVGWLAGVALIFLLPLARPDALLRRVAFGQFASERGALLSAEAGSTATVIVVDRGAGWRLATNGLPESLILPPGARRGRLATAFGLGNLGSAARPGARSLFMVGLGGGVALETIPPEIERLRVAEIEPAVVAANRLLASHRARDPLADSRLEIVAADARALLRRDPAKWEIVVSQPSHPWTAAGAHLYSREFFALVHDRLTPSGVFVQWMGLAFLDAPLLRELSATLLASFREVEVVQLDPGSLLFLASDAALDLAGAGALPGDPAHWAEIGILDRGELADARVLDSAGARRFAAGAPLLSEDRNRLRFATSAPGFRGLEPAALGGLLAPYDSFVADAEAPRRLRRLSERGFLLRATRLARRLGISVETADSLAKDDALLRVIDAGRLALAAGDRFALEELSAALASIPAAHALGREAVLLRAQTLLLRREPDAAAAAAALLARSLGPRASARELLIAAEAEMAAGHFRAARSLLDEVSSGYRYGAPPELVRAYGRLPEALRPFDDEATTGLD